MHTQLTEHASQKTQRNKVVSAAEAVRLIHDGDTVATGGFVGIGFAESGEGVALLDAGAGIFLRPVPKQRRLA